MNAMKLFLSLPVVAAATAVKLNAEGEFAAGGKVEYDGMRIALRNLAGSSGGKIDEGTIIAVNDILITINSTLLVALDADRNHTQNILEITRSAVHQCDTDRTEWFTDVHSEMNGNVTNCHQDHDSCRAQEATEYSNMTTHCNILRDRVCDWEYCNLPAEGFTQGHTDGVRSFMTCVLQFVEDHQPYYVGERRNCIDATNVHTRKRNECNIQQHTCEENQCDRERSVQHRCENYRQICRNPAETYWLKTTKESKAAEGIMQSQRVALECLLCYGNKILQNSTDLSSCDTDAKPCVQLPNCPILAYNPIDAFINCGEPSHPDIPCETAYYANHYEKYDASNTTVDSCEQCHPLVPNLEGALSSEPTQPE